MKTRVLSLSALLSLVPALAQAHPGHAGAELVQGLLHPLTGLDHVLAMLTVGAWAALLGGAARLAVPLTFVLALITGAALPAAPVPLGLIEQGVAATLLLIGALLAFAVRPPLSATLALVAAFALFHGLAHGAAAPADSVATFALGFVASTAVLHAAGFALATLLARRAATPWLRMAGAGVGIAGAVLLATVAG